MKKFLLKPTLVILISIISIGSLFTSCSDDDPYSLAKEHINYTIPEGGYTVKVNQPLVIDIETRSDEGVTYQWFLDEENISTSKNLNYTFQTAGEFQLKLIVSQANKKYEFPSKLVVNFSDIDGSEENATAYITKVLDFVPAIGQFTNKMPQYEEGDTQEIMNSKVLASIGNNKRGMISLGGYGGYVVVGFDHTIKNVAGKRDFRVLGNAFYSNYNPDKNAPEGGSCEPGIIMVAYDSNKNGIPDDNEWYEIEGSSHVDPKLEPWYAKANKAMNDSVTIRDYEITYFRPAKEPTTADEKKEYVKWEDNQGNSGYKVKNGFHNQPYFPQWIKEDKLTFRGTCLPQNGIDESGKGNNFILYKFRYGYADNEKNDKDESAIDISWAINSKGQKVNLPGVDFIKIYTGVNQENGWLGESSTEIVGVEDLHVLGINIDTRK
ncbi:PKD-like domain-containing protein [Dysgonomonas massiliensis]|uniref:PKD-like domain-containing protein n=1 Tax=Dysgonomonas massiliensis TaxID=2040292 RepID=UPI000C7618C4|nr:PKD-like domain-containing protein [Dysgonomonas massiliensis]